VGGGYNSYGRFAPAISADGRRGRFWESRRVVVTGAAGFIGSHVVERLVREGADVRAFVRYNSRNDYGWLKASALDVHRDLEVFRGDLVNPDAVAAAMDGVDTVLHLGALIPIPYSYRHPREFVSANVEGTLNVLEACRRQAIRRVVHTSTSEVYGTPETVPIAETHPLRPQSPYAATKVAADQLALSYHRSYGLPLVVARPFNTYGPRQSARAVIPTVISQALTRDRIELGLVHPRRDFVYVEDTAAGLLACAEAPAADGEVVNLGTGMDMSVHDMVERVLSLVGRNVELALDPERVRPPDSEVERLVADATNARILLGWEPSVDFDEGLRRTLEWIGGALDVYEPAFYNV
jgi:NAD dependent epimerase/dehydratase